MRNKDSRMRFNKDKYKMKKKQQGFQQNQQWNSGQGNSGKRNDLPNNRVQKPTIAKKRPLGPHNVSPIPNPDSTYIKKKPLSCATTTPMVFAHPPQGRFQNPVNDTYIMSPKAHRINVPSASSSSRPITLNTFKEPASAATQRGNIKVIVRVRPPNNRENKPNVRTVVEAVDDRMIAFDRKQEVSQFYFHGNKQIGRDMLKKPNKDVQFNYDHVFGPEQTNYEIFDKTVLPLIETVMDGFNCSVFAYGATGSGKTFTMIGNDPMHQPGLIKLTLNEIFHRIANSPDAEAQVNLSFMEVYNEFITDLLEKKGYLQVRDVHGATVVSNLCSVTPRNVSEALEVIRRGNSVRAQQATEANKESSRSHAILQITILIRDTSQNVNTDIRKAKLVMVDLAGSERGSSTSNDKTGERFREGSNINKSLLALGNCINALADGKTHIPYRDSKLTRILRDSLGGNCKTLMIANVSPSDLSYEDSYNTLKYADRAKRIRYNLSKTEMSASADYSRIIKELKSLQEREKHCRCNVKKLDASTDPFFSSLETIEEDMVLHIEPKGAANTTITLDKPEDMELGEDELMRTTNSTFAIGHEDIIKHDLDLQTKVDNFVRLLGKKRKAEEAHLEAMSAKMESMCRLEIKKRRLEALNLLGSKNDGNSKIAHRILKRTESLASRVNQMDTELESASTRIDRIGDGIRDSESGILEKIGKNEPFKSITFEEFVEFEEAKGMLQKQRVVDKHNQKMIEYLVEELAKSTSTIELSLGLIHPLYKIIRHCQLNTQKIDKDHSALMTEIFGGRVHFPNQLDDHNTSQSFVLSFLNDLHSSKNKQARASTPKKSLRSPPPSPSTIHRRESN